MSTITKEGLEPVIERLEHYATNVKWTNVQAAQDMLIAADAMRIALASLGAEPVCVIDQSNLDYLKSGSDADVWPASRTEMGDVLLYRATPPAPVSMKDHQIRELVNELRDIAIEYQGTQQLRERIARTDRAAMLQGADGNSHVIPDGWVMLPAEPTQAMMNAWLSEVANWRGHAAGYRAMIAAAPQQEVKS